MIKASKIIVITIAIAILLQLTLTLASDTISYQAQVDTLFDPRIPRAILYYSQDLGHKWYDSYVKVSEVTSAEYMGFELISPKRFRFNYHLEIPRDKLDQTNPDQSLLSIANDISDYCTEQCVRFSDLLPSEQKDLITNCKVETTLMVLGTNCYPTTYTNADSTTTIMYPCGASTCQKCSSTKPCVGTRDCIWGTECVENTCGMIKAGAFGPTSTILIIAMVLISTISMFL